MKVILKEEVLILIGEDGSQLETVTQWSETHNEHVFLVRKQSEKAVMLKDLGLHLQVINEPINILYNSNDPAIQLISNLSYTPFELRGVEYASVEGFWQSLKFTDPAARARVSQLYGLDAKLAGNSAEKAMTIQYQDQEVRVGCYEHWQLMKQACWAKFTQHDEARAALLATGERPLTHKVRHDSKTIPGVIMAEIWMKIRKRLQNC